MVEANKEWIKVYTVDEIFASLAKVGEKPYMLVAGNTAHGVYRRSPKLQSFIDISDVQELRGFKVDSCLELGGNVSLTETMEIFAKVATQKANFQYLKERS